MRKFKHKPTIVEAVQWDGKNIELAKNIYEPMGCECSFGWAPNDGDEYELVIRWGGTIVEEVLPGDYIIPSITYGERSITKDEFEQLYESCEE